MDRVRFNSVYLLLQIYEIMLAIVTGSSKGIGYEIVRELIAKHKCTVIAASRNISPLILLKKQKEFKDLLPVSADISTAIGRKKIISAVIASGKKVDLLINNAGELVNRPFEKISEKELQSVYTTNVFSPFLLTQNLLTHFNKKAAHIVNIGSMGGFQGSSKFAGLSAYSSSKAALSGLSECMAVELSDKKIKVNCLALGAVQTEMLGKAFPGYKAPMTAKQMAEYIAWFGVHGQEFHNGKVIPVSLSTP
jgi:3-oxoacyl-[acyl-carrier protein] reductase